MNAGEELDEVAFERFEGGRLGAAVIEPGDGGSAHEGSESILDAGRDLERLGRKRRRGRAFARRVAAARARTIIDSGGEERDEDARTTNAEISMGESMATQAAAVNETGSAAGVAGRPAAVSAGTGFAGASAGLIFPVGSAIGIARSRIATPS